MGRPPSVLGPYASGRDRQIDHVVPVQILIDRILDGADPAAVMSASTCCFVTRVEHHGEGLLGKFRRDHADLRTKMQTCAIEGLADLGWERYRRAGLEWTAVPPRVADPPDDSEPELDDEDA